jgi:hypothetical protein
MRFEEVPQTVQLVLSELCNAFDRVLVWRGAGPIRKLEEGWKDFGGRDFKLAREMVGTTINLPAAHHARPRYAEHGHATNVRRPRRMKQAPVRGRRT